MASADAHPELDELLRGEAQVSHTVRRLRWFKAAFRRHAEHLAAADGLAATIDDRKLVAAFVGWLRLFEAHKPGAPNLKRDYVGFAAGLMLRSLLEHSPAAAPAPDPASDTPAAFWPEGYLYVSYCLATRATVLAQDFGEASAPAPAPAVADIGTWRSFKENVTQDVYMATAFLDLFAGDKPNWEITHSFVARQR